ncbi:winged helix-turn-helix transcriptional regulator [Paenibacillus sp. GCM10028914]|uniref:winged helix-turn-helix transcriptional regulator n=1 Tax=Paenibacillus sp. GCM10028914 TaxID=3273416 RepID=UPI003623C8BC
MTEEDKKHELYKKVERCYEILCKKWMGLIIHTLMTEPKRFSEIHVAIPDLSKRMLNERMKELEDCGLVLRNVITDRPVRTEYSLTRMGNELGASLRTVEMWAKKWL